MNIFFGWVWDPMYFVCIANGFCSSRTGFSRFGGIVLRHTFFACRRLRRRHYHHHHQRRRHRRQLLMLSVELSSTICLSHLFDSLVCKIFLSFHLLPFNKMMCVVRAVAVPCRLPTTKCKTKWKETKKISLFDSMMMLMAVVVDGIYVHIPSPASTFSFYVLFSASALAETAFAHRTK